MDGARDVEPGRDQLEAEAWSAAEARGLPVLGICRGFQAMNVFAGGTLRQHVGGHAGPGWGHGEALTHPLRAVPGTRLTRILYPTNVGGGVLTVNSYHHQGVTRDDLAPGFVAAAFSPGPDGELVEAFESAGGPFRMAVQCHPERTESTPRAFERLFAFFVDACRGPRPAADAPVAARRELHPAGFDDPVAGTGASAAPAGSLKIRAGGPCSRIRPGVEEADPVRDVAREAHLVGRDDHRHARPRPAPGSRSGPRRRARGRGPR